MPASPPRPRIWPTLALFGLAAGAAALARILWVMGDRLTQPSRAECGPPPEGFPAEPASFRSGDSLLRGWFAPGEPGAGAVVLMHGIHSNRTSLLPQAQIFHRAGFAVLLFDFQAHGESEGQRITCGYLESRDAEAAVSWLRAKLPGERIGAYGFSLGGLAALLPEPPLEVDALIVEGAPPTLRHGIKRRMRRKFGWLGRFIAPLLCAQFPLRAGITVNHLAPVDHAGAIRAPLLIIAGDEDRQTPQEDTWLLFAAAPPGTELWMIPGATHTSMYETAGEAYEIRVLGFLGKHLRSQAPEAVQLKH